MTDPEQKSEEQEVEQGAAAQEVSGEQESPAIEAELPADEDILREAIDATLMYPQVSGIGTERGSLEALLEKHQSGIKISEEDLDFARLVTLRARDVTQSYLS